MSGATQQCRYSSPYRHAGEASSHWPATIASTTIASGKFVVAFKHWKLLTLLILRDAVIVATGNVLTAFFAGFVIFGIIGFMAFELGTTVDKVATQGRKVLTYNSS